MGEGARRGGPEGRGPEVGVACPAARFPVLRRHQPLQDPRRWQTARARRPAALRGLSGLGAAEVGRGAAGALWVQGVEHFCVGGRGRPQRGDQAALGQPTTLKAPCPRPRGAGAEGNGEVGSSGPSQRAQPARPGSPEAPRDPRTDSRRLVPGEPCRARPQGPGSPPEGLWVGGCWWFVAASSRARGCMLRCH